MKSLKDMVEDLIALGWTQTKISAESDVSQPTISRLLAGNGIAYESGKRIEALHAHHTRVVLSPILIPGHPIDGATIRETIGKTRRVGDYEDRKK